MTSAPSSAPVAPAWNVPASFDGSAASLGEHVAAISAMMRDERPLWLGPFAPPASLPAGFEHTALVVPTSGSTGAAKAVALSRAALVASQDATARALAADGSTAGHGLWLPLLPPTHIAGIQVIARACRAAQVLGRPRPLLPQTLPDLSAHFDARSFATAAGAALEEAAQAGVAAFTSLVPTQLARLLDEGGIAGERARELLGRFSAVLVGGAATPPRLRERAEAAGVSLRATYGSSETAGGCVYDGHALDGVRLRVIDADASGSGRLAIASPTLALGYLRPDGTPDPVGFAEAEPAGGPGGDRREFLTSDLATLRGDELRILGRADDVVITGGRKVLPQDVEHAIDASEELDGAVAGRVVVGVPDPEWGEHLAALVVPAPGADVERLPDRVRAALREGPLPAHAVPKRTVVVDTLPLRGIGKIDRSAARAEAIALGA